MFRPLLRAKYSFLRECVGVKRRLEEYSSLEVMDVSERIKLSGDAMTMELAWASCRSLAILIWCLEYRDAKTAYLGGVERVKRVLICLECDRRRYGFL